VKSPSFSEQDNPHRRRVCERERGNDKAKKKYGWPAVMEKKRRERRWFGRIARGRDKKTREGKKMGASWF
jgi:hypothetical protein